MAELQAASGGGEGEPVADANPFAWAVVEKGKDAGWCYAFRSDKDQAQREFPPSEFFHFPLYRQPPQPRGWLTAEEREAVEWFSQLDQPQYLDAPRKVARVAQSLLARSSPPEVVLPEMVIAYDDIDMLKEALAAAGVAVKEVG